MRRWAAAVVALAVAASCTGGRGRDAGGADPSNGPSEGAAAPVQRPRGGSVRVGVWAAPVVDGATLGGAAVRALVFPQLFVAGPDGRWAPSLIEPGSDRASADATSASFRLRPGATWSDGRPITVDDLRRSADARFVASVEGPAPDGGVTVRFNGPLPGWRRLWSFTDSVAPPEPGIWGGPFVVASATPGLETVLRRNDRWFGGPGPFLDEVRLVLVPDVVTARLLLARGELDVVAPLAHTVRARQLEAVAGVRTSTSSVGGWWVALFLNPERLMPQVRRGVVATVERPSFVGTLMSDEAVLLDSFATPPSTAWAGFGPGDARPLGRQRVDLVGMVEEPMTGLLQRSMQRRARAVDAELELRNAEADRVEGWLRDGDYDAALVPGLDAPTPCWTCRWAHIDADLARAADAGDVDAAGALEGRLRDDSLVLPLWRGRTIVAWRNGVGGVMANGYGLSAAWNAWEWWRGSE